MIKYIGSKRLLVPRIVAAIRALRGGDRVADLFSGTSRVAKALKLAGFRVHANDYASYAHVLATAYVQADGRRWAKEAADLIGELRTLPGAPGWFTETYCTRSRYIQPHNGARIDAIRERIAGLRLPFELESILLAALVEAADRVDSTTGLQMAYLKQWAARSHGTLDLRLPDLAPGAGKATMGDAVALAPGIEADVAYLDPPYNQHSYLGNYHVWESLVRWDKSDVYGVACKRVDVRERRSAFNSRRRFRAEFERLVRALPVPCLVVSFSDEGFLGRADVEEILAARGRVEVLEIDYGRYVGARIGIYNPSGEKVGKVSHLRNREYLFFVAPDAAAARAARDAAASPA